MAISFSASVDTWVKKTEARTTAVFRESAKRVAREANKTRAEGGRMRVDTGFLRASRRALLNSSAFSTIENPPGFNAAGGDPSAGEVALVIAGAGPGDVISFAWTANYARAREYGSRGQAPDGFVAGATAQWKRIVKEVAIEIRGRSS
jgi:hypothetical protein